MPAIFVACSIISVLMFTFIFSPSNLCCLPGISFYFSSLYWLLLIFLFIFSMAFSKRKSSLAWIALLTSIILSCLSYVFITGRQYFPAFDISYNSYSITNSLSPGLKICQWVYLLAFSKETEYKHRERFILGN
jgi:hypothetical protein